MMAAEPSTSSLKKNRDASMYQKKQQQQDDAGQSFVIGKIDAGIAVLISDSVHLIEFPSLLLPAGVGPGSIVNISCSRNVAAERAATTGFWDLQKDIFDSYGATEPTQPVLRVRNVTQTSVTLEWDKLELAQANLLGLSIWRNGQRLTTIPNPLNNTSTKLSGLALDTDYTFHLVMKTTAGTFSSPVIKIHTHTIEDTSGVSVCFGLCEPESLLEDAKKSLEAMKARGSDKIQIDTTHFVATSPASPSNPNGGPGVEYQKALQLSIPVVSPEWVIACAREKKLVAIANYYSVGTTNHAASISSAQLVSPSGQPITKQALPRRATVVSVDEEGDPVPAVAPPANHRSELAEEEPDAPPQTEEPAPEAPEPEAPEPEEPEAPETVEEVVKQVEQEQEAVDELVESEQAKKEAEVEVQDEDVKVTTTQGTTEEKKEDPSLKSSESMEDVGL